MGAAAAQHEFVSDLLLLWSAAVCLLAAAAAAFLGVSTFLCSWFPGFWSFGETDRPRAMSSISGPGINAFSWGRGCKGMLKNKEREVFASFSSTVTHVVQVTSYGTLGGDFLGACAAPPLDGETQAHHQSQRRQECRRCGVCACGQSSSRI